MYTKINPLYLDSNLTFINCVVDGGRDADDSSYSYVGRESKSGDHAKKEKGSGDSGGPDVHNLRYEDNLLIEDVIANDPSVFVKLKLEGKDGENKQSGGSNNNVLIDLTGIFLQSFKVILKFM